ncbi:MAG: hypothetical protein ACT4PZ_06420 [Panacagrimonas sp.]
MNNTLKTFRFSILAGAALFAVGAALSQPASAAAYLKYDAKVNADGSHDSNWFNPANWSGGQVPGPRDSVELDRSDYVLIDQAKNPGGGKVHFQDLHLRDAARFEVIGGAIVQTRDQVLSDQGQIIFRASGDVGESLVADCSGCTLVQNPTTQSKRIIVLKSSVTVDMGLGGTEPASVLQDAAGGYQLAAGPGHYSTTTVDTLVIDGDLKLSTYYGFQPRPGQRFQIATVNGTRTGEFIGIPEGGYVGCTEQNVGLRLSYKGGDGNDLVISAEQTDPGTCLLLPAVQKVREAASRSRQATLDLVDSAGGAAAGLLLPAVQKVREAAVNPLVNQFKFGVRPGEPLHYECVGTQCSCFGEGCKGIAAACKADTLECGLYQCVCEKK